MSSGQKRCSEDEDDWYDLCVKHKLVVSPSWDCYSIYAKNTREAVKKYPNLSGDYLRDYVICMNNMDSILYMQQEEYKDYQTYLRLKDKFEK